MCACVCLSEGSWWSLYLLEMQKQRKAPVLEGVECFECPRTCLLRSRCSLVGEGRQKISPLLRALAGTNWSEAPALLDPPTPPHTSHSPLSLADHDLDHERRIGR